MTGDSDLIPAIRIAKDEGVVVRLAHGSKQHRPHRELWNLVDERLELDPRWFAQCLKS